MTFRPVIVLTAIEEPLASAWDRWCGDLAFVSVHRGSVFDAGAVAVVSPANSFGFMDGGIDRLYLERFGSQIQDQVQKEIQRNHFGELLVGQALGVDTNDIEIPFLIAAPTMRVPTTLESSINPYLAARAVLLLVRDGHFRTGRFEGEPIRDHISSIAFPGLGTGVGRVPPVQCARQVRAAIEDVVLERFEFPQSTSQIRKRHDRLTQSAKP